MIFMRVSGELRDPRLRILQCRVPLHLTRTIVLCSVMSALVAPSCSRTQESSTSRAVPRTADGKPNLQGIWQVSSRAAYDLQDHVAREGMPAGRSVVEGGEIPYQPWAAAKRIENAANRKTADPLAKCYMPGVPRIMYMEYPFHIFQASDHIAIAFEWSQVFRVIYTNGAPAPAGIEFWMGDSRGRWEGDTLVVDVRNHNNKTWFDMAGDFHSEALHLVERYTMLDQDTIQYEVTIEDPKVFTRPWKISMPIHRHKSMDRILEYQCNAEMEEANGAFERDPRTWYPGPSAPPQEQPAVNPKGQETSNRAATPKESIRRMTDGKPDLQGYYMPDGGGANYGLEKHAEDFLTPGGRGVIVDPPDGKLPLQEWARAEQQRRVTPERGYDDPTAHCFVAGVPRSMYAPSPIQIMQPPGYVVLLFERMSWRTIPVDGRPHIPDSIRLWQGDSLGRWEGDTLVVVTANLNGKTWLNEVGEIVSHAERVVERFTPVDATTIDYRATVTDPLVYTRPWTIAFPLKRQKEELLEIACHEDNQDLQHLKDIRDAARAKSGQSEKTGPTRRSSR
jgi:hypothetical protein